jgi:glycosyltransferase involved in cell wall biosynthesis
LRRAQDVPGIPRERLRTIHNGTDLSRIPETRTSALRVALGLSPKTLLIGALGNVRTPKGYDLLLSAVAALRSAGADIHLVIAGDDSGVLGDQLRAHRATLGLEPHVTLLGYRDDPGEFLAGVDLFVLASTSEGFSIATVQASAAGLPLVATRSGGPEEIVVHQKTGLLVDAGKVDALVGGIRQLMDDPAAGGRMGLAARQRAAELFSLPAMLSAYDALYSEVVRT